MHKKEVFIFVGPPKTGTTSLQHWLMQNHGNGYIYLGCMQPRSKYEKNDFSFKLYKALEKKHMDSAELAQISKELEHYARQQLPLIISEESFLHRPDWQKKMRGLLVLFSGWEMKIAICHRNASSVIPSYFAETYSYIPSEYQRDYVSFINSDWVNQYDIKFLYEQLIAAGFKENQLSIFDFKKLTGSELSLNQIFDSNHGLGGWDNLIFLNHENKKSTETKSLKVDSKVYNIEVDRLNARLKRFKKLYKRADLLLKGTLSRYNLIRLKQVKKIHVPHHNMLDELEDSNLIFLNALKSKKR